MKKAWSLVLTIVMIALLLGVVSVGVGLITGASSHRINTTLSEKIGENYDFVMNVYNNPDVYRDYITQELYPSLRDWFVALF